MRYSPCSSREVISVDSYYLEATRLPSANVARRSFFSVAGGDFVTFPDSGLSGIQGVDEVMKTHSICSTLTIMNFVSKCSV